MYSNFSSVKYHENGGNFLNVDPYPDPFLDCGDFFPGSSLS